MGATFILGIGCWPEPATRLWQNRPQTPRGIWVLAPFKKGPAPEFVGMCS